MFRKKGILILACFCSSLLIVVGLILASGELRSKNNSFLRLFPSHPVLEAGVFDVKYNSYYIAGGTADNIYLGNYASPLHLLALHPDLMDTSHISLHVEGIEQQKFWSLRVVVDAPAFYLHDGAVPRIYKGTVGDWRAARVGYDTEFFLDIVPIDGCTFFIKSLDAKTKESVLGMVDDTAPHFHFKKGLLQKQIDGVFCTDGMMSYDKELSKMIYLYRYRNEYMAIDTNLHLSYRANTIDTISRARIRVSAFEGGNNVTMSAPPLTVNKQMCAYKNWLFVSSGLLARNERPASLDRASVIDVYDLRNRKYQFSFYVYDYQDKEKLRDFKVMEGRFIALYETHLQLFNLRQEYFPG